MVFYFNFSELIVALLGDKTKNHDAWIGLDDIHHEGKFTFLDGVASTDENTGWKANQPDNHHGIEDCVHLHWQDPNSLYNTANDLPCSDVAFALCEKPL